MTDVVPQTKNELVDFHKGSPTAADRAKAQTHLMEKVEDERFARPVPRFLTFLPYGGDDDEITDRIASAILVSENPDEAAAGQSTTAGRELVGKKITVWDVRVMDGDKPGGWGAYMLADITVGDDEVHQVINTGAKQVVATWAAKWARGEMPFSGTFAEIDSTGKRGNKALAFIIEQAF